LLVLSLAGCSLSPGQALTLFPERHQLLDAAKDLRQPEMPLPLPRELAKEVQPAFIVEPGDVLLVQPAELESTIRFPGDQPVLPDGTIDLGRYGRPVVAGKRVEEIEGLVRSLVQAQVKDKDVGPINVRLMSRQSKVYYVLGEVNNPGSFQLIGRETVLDAILAAGGLTDKASRENIILSRPSPPHSCRTVLPICYPQIVQFGDTTTNYQLTSGDRVYVPSRTLCESLFHRKAQCGFCNGPQVPCPPPGGHGAPAGVLPPAGTLPDAVPVGK
jgi:protein involved in polysaccharide export with SLBB domain